MKFVRWRCGLATGALVAMLAGPVAAEPWFPPSDDASTPPAPATSTAPTVGAEPPPAPAAQPAPVAPATAPAASPAPPPPARPAAAPRPEPRQPLPANAPKVLPYRRGDEVPPGYHVVSRPRWGLVIPGGILFALGYGLAVAVALDPDDEKDRAWLFVPILGPTARILERQANCKQHHSADHCNDFGTMMDNAGFEVVVLALQAPGAALLIAGLATPRKRLVRDDHVSLDLVPVALPGGAGLGMVGRF